MTPRPITHRYTKVWLSLLATIAIALSLWLTIEKLTGRIDTLAGCGAASASHTSSSCANVLGSKWSMLFGVIPISILSLSTYLVIIISLWFEKPLFRHARLLSAWLLLWAAVWFTILQLFVIKTICPYCMTVHGLGSIIAISILIAERRLAAYMMTAALTLVSAVALIQHLGPEPASHRIDQQETLPATSRFFNGEKTYALDELPHIGAAKPERVIVKYFDYRCEACHEVHEQLTDFIQKHPSKLAVILIPVPLNHSCNPHLPETAQSHTNACELAELALRAWSADRSRFAEIHHTLFEISELPLAAAEAMIYGIIGEEAMSSVDDAWVAHTLKLGLEDYKALSTSTPVMPKILLEGSSILQGKAKDQATFEAILLAQ